MSKKLQKHKGGNLTIKDGITQLPESVIKEIERLDGELIQVGYLYIDGRGKTLIRIREIRIAQENAVDGVPQVHINFDHQYRGEWSPYGDARLDDFLKRWIRLDPSRSVESYLEEAEAFVESGGDVTNYQDKTKTDMDNALIHLGSKESLQALRDGINERRKKADLIRAFVNFKMEKIKAEMESMRRRLEAVVSEMSAKIARIEKVIWTIELYLGIKEDIVQIQEGGKAPKDAVICFRQEVLCMDEEVGTPEDDGLDFDSISDFDSWLCRNENYKIVIPEEKGVVVLRVRRHSKEYTANPFINGQMNIDNKKTYILIRNGDCLYRIWADIQIWPRLFPRRSELMDALAEIERKEKDKNEHFFRPEEEREKLEDEFFRYQQQIILLQGLIDRTDIFYPLPGVIKLTNEKTHESGLIRFIYDDEVKLPDSRLPFWQWHSKVNEGLTEGTRIVYADNVSARINPNRVGDDYSRDNMSWRYDDRFYSESNWNLPSTPNSGIYVLQFYKKKVQQARKITFNRFSDIPERYFTIGNPRLHRAAYEKRKDWPVEVDYIDENGSRDYYDVIAKSPAIYYNPKDEVRNWWDRWDDGHVRKKNISFKVRAKDTNVINLDNVSLDDVEFYLNSRVNRRHYLQMIPLLNNLKKFLTAEIERESHFIDLVAAQCPKASRKSIKEAVTWWKLKNKWKRGLNADDSKAFRMITKKLKV